MTFSGMDGAIWVTQRMLRGIAPDTNNPETGSVGRLDSHRSSADIKEACQANVVAGKFPEQRGLCACEQQLTQRTVVGLTARTGALAGGTRPRTRASQRWRPWRQDQWPSTNTDDLRPVPSSGEVQAQSGALRAIPSAAGARRLRGFLWLRRRRTEGQLFYP